MSDFLLEPGQDQNKVPTRLLFVQADERPPVDVSDEPMVMTVPHLLVREAIAFLGLSIVLVVLSLGFDAPLEELADPVRTPNPAKAPWYFLGLQELLHYYPPVVSGVLLPGLLIVALAVIPYFEINLTRPPLYGARAKKNLAFIWSATVILSAIFYFTAAQPAWPIIVPLWTVAVLATLGATFAKGWLRTRSLPFWIFTWFLLTAMALTIIGVFFRGPGWGFTLPWREGIFG